MSGKKELMRQTNIIKSAKAAGGWGIKLANQHSAGIVDLMIVMPDFAPVMIEVKDLGLRAKTPIGSRINTSPLQRHFMDKANGISRGVFSFVLTTYHIGRDHFVFATLPSEQVITTLEDRFKVPAQDRYPIVDILNHMDVPKMREL